jgi:hypothetical protein
MTCNQLIVLMDVRRGFHAEGHCGTLPGDVKQLRWAGLVEGVDPLRLTKEGEEVCDAILQYATDRVAASRRSGENEVQEEESDPRLG